jgi:hypothetical protein
MSPNLSPMSLPQLPSISAARVNGPSDPDAFAQTLESATNNMNAGDRDLGDGSDLDPDASLGTAVLDKLSALSKADQTEMAEIHKPIENTGMPTLATNGTTGDSNEIGPTPAIGDTKGPLSMTGALNEIIQKAQKDAVNTIEKEALINGAGNVNNLVHTLTSQQ